MTDNSIRDRFTELEENPGLYNSNGLPNSTAVNKDQTPFYVDNKGDLNFGYGFDITTNGGNNNAGVTSLVSYLGNAISDADRALLKTQLTAYLAPNSTITLSNLNASLAQIDWRPIAAQVTDNYYAANVDSVLPSQLQTYTGLTSAQVSGAKNEGDICSDCFVNNGCTCAVSMH